MLQSLGTIKTLNDPLKQYMVEFDIREFPVSTVINTHAKFIGMLGNLGKYNRMTSFKAFKLRAQSFSYPTSKIKQTEVNINGFKRKIGSLQDKSGTWTCKVFDDYEGGVSQLIQSWMDCIHNTETGIRLPATLYSTTCQVSINTKDGGKERSIYLRGFYPISYTINEINVNSSEPVTVDVTFNYDFFSGTEHGL
jgi:hypothetical protein